MSGHLFQIGDRVTVERSGTYRGVVASIMVPTDGLPGSVEVARDRDRLKRALSYSGSICREHQRPAPPYEGAPHIAPTRPHYDVVAGDLQLHVCECTIVAAPAPALFEVES